MATEKEEILLEIKIDKPTTEKEIEKLTESIEALKNSNAALAAEQVKLKKAGQDNTKEFIENAKQIELNKYEINKNTSERKNLISAIKAEDNSLQALKARLAENKAAIQNINTANEQGKKKYQELEKAIEADTKALGKAEAQQGSFFRNVGNYTGALDALTGGMASSAQGAAGLGKQLWALVANPIGAILAAIAAVLLLIASYFKNSGDGADIFEKRMAQLNAILNVVIDRLSALVRGLIAFVSGDFEEGINQMGNAFKGVGDEMEREIQLAGELADMLDELGDAERRYAVAASETINEIKRLIIESKNRLLTEQQRQALLDKALQLEQQRVSELNELRETGLRAAVLEAQQRANTQQGINESLEDYAKRLLDADKLTDDVRDAIKDALIEQQDAIGESLALQEKIQNQIAALQEKAEDERRKRQEQREKEQDEALEKEIQRLRDKYLAEQEEEARNNEIMAELRAADGENTDEQIEARREKYLEGLSEEARQEFQIKYDLELKKQGLLQWTDQQHAAYVKAQQERERKAAEYEKQIDRLKNDAISGGIEMITKEKSAARIALNVVFKQDAIRETTINGYNAAVAAYKSLAGIPIVGPALGAVAAALVAAFTIAQVGRIAGIQFARGGKAATTGGKSHAQGGTKYYGEDGNIVELEAGENWYVLNRGASSEINRLSALNVKHGGVDFSNKGWHRAVGGQVETRQAANINRGEVNVAQLVTDVLENTNIIVTVEDINAGQNRVSEITNKAQVI